jgi:hypothetical protein
MTPFTGIFGEFFAGIMAPLVAAEARATTTAAGSTTAPATTTSGGSTSFTDSFEGDLTAWNQTHVTGSRDFSVSGGAAQLAISSWSQAETVAMRATPMASPEHLAQIVEASLVTGYDGWHKLIARADSAEGNPDNAYVLVRHRTPDYGGPLWALKRRVEGVETLLASGSPFGAYGDPATWRLTVSGTGATVTVTVWSSVDGTLATYEDTSEDRLTAGDCVGWAAGYDASSSWEFPMAVGEFHAEVL